MLDFLRLLLHASAIEVTRPLVTDALSRISSSNGRCNPEMTRLFEAQSQELDQKKRLKMVWEIDRKLQEDIARPIIAHPKATACWQPYV